MSRDAKWDSDDRECHAREWKGKAFVDFSAAGAAFFLVLAFQLLKQLLDGQRRTAGPLFLFFVKVVKTDRQCAFHHINSISDLAQIRRIFWVGLLVTRVIQVHENLLVRQISFEDYRPREGHLYPHRILVLQIESRAAQFFLRSRRSLNVEPKTNSSAEQRNRAQRDANA